MTKLIPLNPDEAIRQAQLLRALEEKKRIEKLLKKIKK